MSDGLHVAVYRRLIRVYPAEFRAAYGADMVAVFSRQLCELGPARCWLRTWRDLAVSVPSQHLEHPMQHAPATRLTAGCLVVAVSGTVAALVTGISFYGVLLSLVVAGALGVAVRSRRAAEPAIEREHPARWKAFLIAGAALLAVLIVLLNLPGTKDQELSEAAWSVMMLSLLSSFTLIAAGVVLGATELLRGRGRP